MKIVSSENRGYNILSRHYCQNIYLNKWTKYRIKLLTPRKVIGIWGSEPFGTNVFSTTLQTFKYANLTVVYILVTTFLTSIVEQMNAVTFSRQEMTEIFHLWCFWTSTPSDSYCWLRRISPFGTVSGSSEAGEFTVTSWTAAVFPPSWRIFFHLFHSLFYFAKITWSFSGVLWKSAVLKTFCLFLYTFIYLSAESQSWENVLSVISFVGAIIRFYGFSALIVNIITILWPFWLSSSITLPLTDWKPALRLERICKWCVVGLVLIGVMVVTEVGSRFIQLLSNFFPHTIFYSCLDFSLFRSGKQYSDVDKRPIYKRIPFYLRPISSNT